MKCQDLFSLKNKENQNCHLLQLWLALLRININAVQNTCDMYKKCHQIGVSQTVADGTFLMVQSDLKG